jgi:hypothetical protein
MPRAFVLSAITAVISACPALASERLRGTYVEARTCQVYTGPCFANGEVGSVGKDAIMAWNIERGSYAGTELSGRSVAVVIKASHTLGFRGLADAQSKQAIVIVDQSADEVAAQALTDFALQQTGLMDNEIAAVHRAEINMQFDRTNVTAKLSVDRFAELETRRARSGDCICSNESAYYPPLAKLQGFVPGVTIEGDVRARAMGTRWSIPDSRTAYLGTFDVDGSNLELAGLVR